MKITKNEFDNLPYIGEGTEGIVRKYNNLALKEMYEFAKDKQKSINAQCKISLNTFIFPIDILLINEEYKGYVQNIVKGNKPNLDNLNNLKKDIEMIKSIENEFSYLTFYKLLINDLLTNNSIFYDNQIYIIDTSRYTLENESSYTLIERENQRRINYFLINCLFLDYLNHFSIFDLNKVMCKLNIASIYNNTYVGVNPYFDKPVDFSYFLYNLCEELKCDKLKDLHNKILKLK